MSKRGKEKPVTLEELAERVAALEAHNGWVPAPAPEPEAPADGKPADGDDKPE